MSHERELGIPDSAIVMGRGANTGEELQNAKRYLTDADASRVGLLTSAWHMPRALRHAERNGLGKEKGTGVFFIRSGARSGDSSELTEDYERERERVLFLIVEPSCLLQDYYTILMTVSPFCPS